MNTWNNLTLGEPAGDVVMGRMISMTNAEALNIDKKTDDGLANTGKTRGYHSSADTYICDDTGADYYSISAQGAETGGKCHLSFSLN